MENDATTSVAEVSEETVSETVAEAVTAALGEETQNGEVTTTVVEETTAAVGQELDAEYTWSVVLTGFFVVFVTLVLLIFFVWLLHKVFSAMGGNSSKKDQQNTKPAEKKTESVKGSAMKVESGINGEIVAAITAAIASLGAQTGRKLKVCGISKHDSSSRRGAWGNAAAAENTRSF